jgi:crotonobetainyl-CoA:carnitine CoA-transferase CaiB-like acyl-CoA transferase
VSVADDAQWQALCRVLGRADLAADARLAQAAGRRVLHDMLDDALGAWAAQRTPDEAMQSLQQAGVSAGAVRSMPQVLQDSHLHARGFWQQVTRAHVGHYIATTPWYRQGHDAMPIRHVAPTLGQHSHEVLSRLLGLTASQIQSLEQQGVTGTAARPKPPARSP